MNQILAKLHSGCKIETKLRDHSRITQVIKTKVLSVVYKIFSLRHNYMYFHFCSE